MIKKTTLKVELNVPTTAVLNELLKAAGRPTAGQNVEDADADLLRKAVPYWRKGHDYVESFRRAHNEVSDRAVEEQPDNSNGNGNAKPADSTLVIQHQVRQQQANLDKKNEQVGQQATLTKAVGDERKNQALYWYARAAAAGSPQVQESEEVTTARDFYFQMVSGDVAGSDVVADMEATLEDLGFLGQGLESLLPADTTSYLLEHYSSPNGSETENHTVDMWQ